ncbi:uncharacterized protein DAT39_008648, partial [Clarias magur]
MALWREIFVLLNTQRAPRFNPELELLCLFMDPLHSQVSSSSQKNIQVWGLAKTHFAVVNQLPPLYGVIHFSPDQ